jgi:CRISPR-associated protein Cas1
VILDSDGAISFDALRRCERQGISVVWPNGQGEVALLTPGRPADAALVRAQALLTDTAKLSLAVGLVAQKVLACAATLRHMPSSPPVTAAAQRQDATAACLREQPPAVVDAVRLFKARAAQASFNAWGALPLRWAGTRRQPIPEAWRTLAGRASALTGVNRRATHPVNALLNYADGVLEGAVRIAVAAAGLDPTLGVFHATHPGRPARSTT